MQLAKATIGELNEQDREQNPFPVQFNPTTLRLALANRVEGAESQGKQVRQYLGPSSTTLTVDLIFDTADEGTTENPRSVREKTKRLERFLVAKRSGQQGNVPPRMQFTWGDLIVIGVIESLSIDFDHFAPNGVPLRAKVALSIKGQDREKQLEPRSDSRRDAPAPGGGGSAGLGLGASLSAGLGVSGGLGVAASLGASASIGLALGGESAADFAARMGVDASAWRSLALGGESSLSFSAGAEIAFTAGASASLGLGFAAGVTAGASASLEASLGLTAGAWSGVVATSGGSGSAGASGIALTSAGGVAAALGAVQTAKIEAAAQQARAAFQAPPKSASASPGVSTTPRASPGSSRDRGPSEVAAGATRSTALPPATGPAVGTSAAGAPQGSAPRLDARASSFGFGVPLRTTVGEAAEQRALTLRGATALRGQVGDGAVPETDDPTVPPWVALPERGLGAEVITAGLGTRRRAGSCGCGG